MTSKTEADETGSGAPARVRLLFVCTGNTCRSPLAEVIARAEAERRGWMEIEASSAGTFAYGDQPASRRGVEVAAEHGLDLSGHRSTTLDFWQLSDADIVLAMTPEHREAALHIHPAARVYLLPDFLPAEHPRHGGRVADPIGGGRREYLETYRVLDVAIRGLFDRLPEILEAGRRE